MKSRVDVNQPSKIVFIKALLALSGSLDDFIHQHNPASAHFRDWIAAKGQQLSVVSFLSIIPAIRWVDTFGRRQLQLIGAVGMVLGHLFTGIAFATGCDGSTDYSGCSKAPSYIIVIGTSFFTYDRHVVLHVETKGVLLEDIEKLFVSASTSRRVADKVSPE
ncbi:hypothetical protein ATCC90586_004541 [Pythium insidiosum]|nr:hypothetical protein ATCC90586_004541 [Pythium insidiosum]